MKFIPINPHSVQDMTFELIANFPSSRIEVQKVDLFFCAELFKNVNNQIPKIHRIIYMQLRKMNSTCIWELESINMRISYYKYIYSIDIQLLLLIQYNKYDNYSISTNTFLFNRCINHVTQQKCKIKINWSLTFLDHKKSSLDEILMSKMLIN